MDPLYEQRLRDEVVYLHSLWHQGPPRAIAGPSNHPHPSKTTEFKKVNKRRGKRGRKTENKPEYPSPDSNSISGREWPCPSPPPPRTSWGNLESQPNPGSCSPSPEEHLRAAAITAEQHAVKAILEFLKSYDSDDSDGIDSSSDEDDELMEEDDGREEYSFFCKLFMENAELSEKYKKNFIQGNFSCLVCSAVGGKKRGRRYKGCPALIQHSITIAKTKKRRAHRAFGQAVCKVLGWDIDKLPTIVSALSDKAGVMQGSVIGENKDDSVTIINDVCPVECNTSNLEPENESIFNEILANDGDGTMESVSGENKDDPVTTINDVCRVECNTSNLGPESESIFNEILANDGDGTMNSLTCPGVENNLEDIGMLNPLNVEEPATDGVMTGDFSLMYPDGDNISEDISIRCVAIDSSTYHDADNNNQDLAMLCPQKVDEPATEDLPSSSLKGPGDNELEDLGVLKPLNAKEPASAKLMIILKDPVNENSVLGNEIQDLQVDNTHLNGAAEDNETRDEFRLKS